MFQLSVNDLRLWIHLGCDEQERFLPQPVGITISIAFKAAPKAMVSDNLDDTICYADTVKSIEKMCQNRHFRLVEFLAAEIGRQVDASLKAKKSVVQSITVTVSKLKPPVANVHGAVSFTYIHTPE